MYLVIKNDDLILCQDNRYRRFVNYGTYPECVKEYRSLGWAKRKAKRSKADVAQVPKGATIEATGRVLVESPGEQPGMVTTTITHISMHKVFTSKSPAIEMVSV